MLQETPNLDGQVPVATPSRALAEFWAKYKRPHIARSGSTPLDPPAPAAATHPADPPAPAEAPPAQVESVEVVSPTIEGETPVHVEAVVPAVEDDSKMESPPARVETKDVYIRPLFDARLANEFNRLCQHEFHNPVHTRVSKMDDDELSTKMATYMDHPSLKAFESYMQSQCLSHLGTYRFGNDEPVEEITAFEIWLQAEKNCLPEPPRSRPLTPPPAPSPISAVKAVLTRANTVDLGGQRAAAVHVEKPRDTPTEPAPEVVISLVNNMVCEIYFLLIVFSSPVTSMLSLHGPKVTPTTGGSAAPTAPSTSSPVQLKIVRAKKARFHRSVRSILIYIYG